MDEIACFGLLGAWRILPKHKKWTGHSTVVWGQFNHNPEGWYTEHEGSHIYYGSDEAARRRAAFQSNAMNDFLARPDCPTVYCYMKQGHLPPCSQ